MATNPILQWLEGGTGTSNGSPMVNKITIPAGTIASAIQTQLAAFAGQAVFLDFTPGAYPWTSGLTLNGFPLVIIQAVGAQITCQVTDSTNYFSPFIFSQCAEVYVVGFEIDYSNMPFAQGTCTAATTTTATYQLDTSIGIPTFPNIVTIEQMADTNNQPVLVLTIGSKTQYPFTNNGDGTWTVSGLDPAIGALTVVGKRYALLHRKFPYHAFQFIDCQDIYVRHVKIRTVAGMAFFCNRITRGTFLDNEIAPPPDSTRWKSLMADVVHVNFPEEFVRAHRNRILNNGDDGMNISNGGFAVNNVASSTVFTLNMGTSINYGIVINPGDVLDFVDDTGTFQGTSTVLSATGAGTQYRTVTLTAPAPGGFANTWIVYSERYNARISCMNNEIGYNTGRGIVAAGSGVDIITNQFYYTQFSAVSCASVYSRIWHVGDPQKGFNIIGNTIEGCAVSKLNGSGMAIDLIMYAPATQATFTGTIAGTALSVSGVSGTITTGEYLLGAGITPKTQIISGSGSSWQVDQSQTISTPTAMKAVTLAGLAAAGAASDFSVSGNVLRGIQGGGIAVNGWIRGSILANTFSNVAGGGYPYSHLRSAINLQNCDQIAISGNSVVTGNGNLENLGSVTNVVYGVNPGMVVVGGGISSSSPAVKITTFSGAGTTAFAPDGTATKLDVYMVSAGGGGGSGALQAPGASCSGGAGGGGGGAVFTSFSPAYYGTTRNVVLGAGGTGGTAPAGPGATAGNPGLAGGDSNLGTILLVRGGAGGAGGQLAANSGGGGGGGGPFSTPTAGSGTTAGTGALPGVNNGGSGAISALVSVSGYGSGGGGGSNGAAGNAAGKSAGLTILAPSGGGAGGGILAGAPDVAQIGGNGGYAQTAVISGGSAAAGGAVATIGTAGTAGADIFNPGGGGGGGGASVGAVAAGAGGAGARGGGGGGGGSAQTGGGTPGNGANGGDGYCCIVQYY